MSPKQQLILVKNLQYKENNITFLSRDPSNVYCSGEKRNIKICERDITFITAISLYFFPSVAKAAGFYYFILVTSLGS